jgi:4-amino-4-deoxy-L-arabinose transferase-like glycosyltransferase
MPSLSALADRLSRIASKRPTIPLVCLAAFLLRVVVSFVGPDHFWSYTAYYFVADTLVHGGGYCVEPGRLCAFFPPVYPTLVAVGVLLGSVKTGVIVLCSLAGAGTVWMTWRIGALLFSPAAGLLAAVYAAVYPYYVWHDGVLQENATLAFVVSMSVLLLLRVHRSESRRVWVLTGMALGLTVLTKANLTSFVPLAVFWIVFGVRGVWKRQMVRALFVSLGVALLLCPWVLRTWRITGAPILYSNGGFSLWTANHRLTFDYFPELSIDAAQEPEWLDVPPADRHAMYELGDPQFIRETHWFWDRGMAFIRANPGLTARRAIYKVWIAFSPIFSPAHSRAFEAVYFVSYFPLFVLAPFGMWRSRDRWRQQSCIYLLIVSFAVSCAIFWGHTSHRMYLEPYLMIFAASVVTERGHRPLAL